MNEEMVVAIGEGQGAEEPSCSREKKAERYPDSGVVLVLGEQYTEKQKNRSDLILRRKPPV
jgi:hypothetical protein